MALAIDGSTPAAATSSSGTATTASFTPPAGSILVIGFAGNSTGGANPSAPTITDNLGAHLTYTLSGWRSRADGSPTVNGQAALWTAEVATSAAMTVSVTCSLAELAMKVWVFTGQDPVNPLGAFGEAGSASASAVAQSYTAQATSGWGVGAICDWDALGAHTAGTGCTLDGTGNVGGGQISYSFVRRTVADDSNGSSNSLNSILPGTSTNLQWVWQEILPLVVDEDLIDPPPFVTIQAPGGFAPNGLITPWFGAVDAPSQPITLAVTATQGGSTFNGMALDVKMLTGAAPTQNGQTATSTVITTPELAITPNATGSIVYGALLNANGTTSWTANASTTFMQNIPDATNGSCYCTYRSTATTTAATPVTVGASAPTGAGSGGICEAEILSATGLTEVLERAASTAAAITVSTGAFTTVPGSLLVATVSSDGGGSVCTMTVSGGGLTWTELTKANGSGKGYVGVWIAKVPSAGVQVLALTGICSAGDSSYGTAVHVAPRTGVSSVGATAFEVQSGSAQTGTSTAGAAASGTAVKVAPQTGRCAAGVSAVGAAVKRAPATGPALSGATAIGTGRKTAPQTSTTSAGATALATGKHVAPRASNAAAGTSATGTAKKVKALTGNAFAGVAATHSGISTRAVAGTCSAGTFAAGTARHVSARTGTAAAGTMSRGIGVHRAPRTAESSCGTAAGAVVVKKAQSTGNASAGAATSSVTAKTATLTGLTAAGALPTFVSTARQIGGHCYGGAWGRQRRRYTYRPTTTTTPRPGLGTIPRPYSSVTERP